MQDAARDATDGLASNSTMSDYSIVNYPITEVRGLQLTHC
jgi:hypothetical protein